MPRPEFWSPHLSKMGLVGLTTTTALEGRDCGIVASCIHPGNVNTAQMELTPDEPVMAVDDIVKVVMTMATLPLTMNLVEAIVLPRTQLYLGRG